MAVADLTDEQLEAMSSESEDAAEANKGPEPDPAGYDSLASEAEGSTTSPGDDEDEDEKPYDGPTIKIRDEHEIRLVKTLPGKVVLDVARLQGRKQPTPQRVAVAIDQLFESAPIEEDRDLLAELLVEQYPPIDSPELMQIAGDILETISNFPTDQ